jgi:hypothetical protein
MVVRFTFHKVNIQKELPEYTNIFDMLYTRSYSQSCDTTFYDILVTHYQYYCRAIVLFLYSYSAEG